MSAHSNLLMKLLVMPGSGNMLCNNDIGWGLCTFHRHITLFAHIDVLVMRKPNKEERGITPRMIHKHSLGIGAKSVGKFVCLIAVAYILDIIKATWNVSREVLLSLQLLFNLYVNNNINITNIAHWNKTWRPDGTFMFPWTGASLV